MQLKRSRSASGMSSSTRTGSTRNVNNLDFVSSDSGGGKKDVEKDLAAAIQMRMNNEDL